MKTKDQLLKQFNLNIPSIDSICRWKSVTIFSDDYGKPLVTEGIKEIIQGLREDAKLDPEAAIKSLKEECLIDLLRIWLETLTQPSLKPVINLTGTVLHTNLGRAYLPEVALQAINSVAKGPSNLEFDLESGGRGDRDAHMESILCKLTGAEAATVVNNNAAAVFIVVNTLANRKEVPVSRGELVEIGGSFRLPDIIKRAGGKLVDIGTTNRTHLHDYENSISSKTGIILKVHASNYAIKGFTNDVPAEKIVGIANRENIPVVEDLGSGALTDLSRFGLPKEPTAGNSISAGVDIVTFSGDKLLGGPQAGLIVGKKSLIDKIKKNPIKRVTRLDKMTIAALSSVLQLYLDPEKLQKKLPNLALLTRSKAEISKHVDSLLPKLNNIFKPEFDLEVIDCKSQVGSGALPINSIPSKGIAIKSKNSSSIRQLNKLFRSLRVPVIGRITKDRLILDFRCLENDEIFLEQLSIFQAKQK